MTPKEKAFILVEIVWGLAMLCAWLARHVAKLAKGGAK